MPACRAYLFRLFKAMRAFIGLVAVFLAALSVPASAAPRDAVRFAGPVWSPASPAPAPSLAERASRRPLRVIAHVRAAAALTAADRPSIDRVQARVATRLWNRGSSLPGWHSYTSVAAVALEANSETIAALMTDPEVASVQEDRLAKPDLATSVPLVSAPTAWGFGYTGQGVAVVILDTGIDRTHPFFGSRIVHEACFSTTYAPDRATSLCPNGATRIAGAGSAAACSLSACIHGTHVAGIAAGYQSASLAGVAEAASIIAIQVYSRFDDRTICDGASSCVLSYDSDQLAALDYVLSLRGTYTIGAVNMSLGGDVHTSQASCDFANPATKQAIDALRAVGIPTVIASGNDGYANAISEPGCISSAISVGNTTKTDALFSPSNIASFISVMAPGGSITSSVPGGGFAVLSGTSMATPHVAGALAILRQSSPSATVNQLIAALRLGGKSLGFTVSASGQSFSYTVPRLDVVGALGVLCPTCLTPATGWWWNPSEPGRGFSLETRQGRFFLATFLYDDDGSPLWFAANGPQSGATFSGNLVKYVSGQTLSGTYKAPQALASVGTASLSFVSQTAGTLTWPGGVTSIQRFPISGGSVVSAVSGAPESGWWWNESESGTGWFFEVQGSALFMAGYLYDGSGRPIWYASSGAMLSPTAFDGNLLLYGGGQALTGGYRAPTSIQTVGQVSVRFAGTTAATLTLPQGRTISLTRFSSF